MHTHSNPSQSVYWRLFEFNAIWSSTTIIKNLLVISPFSSSLLLNIAACVIARQWPSDTLVTRVFVEADAYHLHRFCTSRGAWSREHHIFIWLVQAVYNAADNFCSIRKRRTIVSPNVKVATIPSPHCVNAHPSFPKFGKKLLYQTSPIAWLPLLKEVQLYHLTHPCLVTIVEDIAFIIPPAPSPKYWSINYVNPSSYQTWAWPLTERSSGGRTRTTIKTWQAALQAPAGQATTQWGLATQG